MDEIVRKFRVGKRVAIVGAMFLAFATPVAANVAITNFMDAEFNAAPPPCLLKVAGEDVPYGYDNSTTASLRVEFCGADTRLNAVAFEDQLVELNGLPTSPPTVGPISQDGAVLRVYPTLTDSHLQLISASGADDYDVTTDVGGLQIQAIGGALTNPAPTFPSQPYSILVDGLSPQVGSLLMHIVDEDQLQIQTDLQLDLAVS